MSRLEERIRDAFTADATTVREETMRGLAGPIGRDAVARGHDRAIRHKSRYRRLLAPLTAAAAVIATVVVAAVVPQALAPGQPAAGSGLPGYFIWYQQAPADWQWLPAVTLQVRAARSGALVSRISLPLVNGPRTYITALISDGTGRYLLAVVNPSLCRSWLYHFSIDGTGLPSALVPFGPLRTVPHLVSQLAVSQNGQKLAYVTESCPHDLSSASWPMSLTVLDLTTGQSRYWSWPDSIGTSPADLSLNRAGTLVAFSPDPTHLRIMPTDASPGSLARRSQVVIHGYQIGRGNFISLAALSASGTAVYIATEPVRNPPPPQPVRVIDLHTGKEHVIGSSQGFGLALDPVLHQLLLLEPTGTAESRPTYNGLAAVNLSTGTTTRMPVFWTHPIYSTGMYQAAW